MNWGLVGRPQAQVQLSEIMFDADGSDAHDEFVEIVNTSTLPVDLTGWQLSDGSGSDNLIAVDAETVLQPDQFGIILDGSYFENSDTYEEMIPAASLILTIDNAAFGSGGFSNSNPETISLINAAGEVVSQYTYSLGNESGFSDEKIDLSGPNSPDNWQDSRVKLGTPGGPNSVSPVQFDLSISPTNIKFFPETPRQGELITISATVKNSGLSAVQAFQIVFFEDFDGDSLAETGEELAPGIEFNENLAPGDSAEFNLDLRFDPGKHLIMVNILFGRDENFANNSAARQLLLAFPQRTLVINEIMYSPLSEQPEWIELLNLSSYDIDLRMWSISDADSTRKAGINEPRILSPGEYFVLAEDSAFVNMFNPPPGSFAVLKDFPPLNNDFDRVVLYDLTGLGIDHVDYRSDWGGATGVSLEKINPDLTSNDSSNWSSSVAFEGGTPGRENSIFARILPADATLSVTPNPFSPDGDGRDDFTLISYDLPTATAVINVKIYDLHGRLIRFLANNQAAGSRNSIVWNGHDDDGQVARMGIYVVFLQALNAQSGILKTTRQTVVLAGEL